ncbi:hypothetical protein [Halobellus salinisoli]|uniref:hypothetical protein n=1 Tax=Halobellus salinisoli TaxID=3108500 RepID=UPI0030095D5F
MTFLKYAITGAIENNELVDEAYEHVYSILRKLRHDSRPMGCTTRYARTDIEATRFEVSDPVRTTSPTNSGRCCEWHGMRRR